MIEATQPAPSLFSQLAWDRIAIFGSVHLLAVAAFAFPFQWRYLPIALAVYAWCGLSCTLYLHRYLSRKSFEMHGPTRFFFFLGSQLGFHTGPAGWVALHRWHHAKADQEEDVQSPIHGFFRGHCGYIFVKPPSQELVDRVMSLSKDIQDRYAYVRFVNDKPVMSFVPFVLAAIGLTLWLGLGGMGYCLALPVVVNMHGIWSTSSFCHSERAGSRLFKTRDHSTNVWWVGLLYFGEGWHNNHHADPACAAAGRLWYQIDLTKYLIAAMEKTKLAWNVRWERAIPRAEAA